MKFPVKNTALQCSKAFDRMNLFTLFYALYSCLSALCFAVFHRLNLQALVRKKKYSPLFMQTFLMFLGLAVTLTLLTKQSSYAAIPEGSTPAPSAPFKQLPPPTGATSTEKPKVSSLRPILRSSNLQQISSVDSSNFAKSANKPAQQRPNEVVQIKPTNTKAPKSANAPTTGQQPPEAQASESIPPKQGGLAALFTPLSKVFNQNTNSSNGSESDDFEPEVTSNEANSDNTYIASSATIPKAVNFSKTNLIGIFSNKQTRHALIRYENGKLQRVQVGDQLDNGWLIRAISNDSLTYQKKNQLFVLELVSGS